MSNLSTKKMYGNIKPKISLYGNIKTRTSLHGNMRGSKIYPALENLEVTPSGKEQIFNHPNSYGYDVVTVNPISESKASYEKWYIESIDCWDGTIITNLTEEQYNAMENMKISLTDELIFEYDDEILNLDFSIDDKDLIINNNVKDLYFYINNKGELEAIY